MFLSLTCKRNCTTSRPMKIKSIIFSLLLTGMAAQASADECRWVYFGFNGSQLVGVQQKKKIFDLISENKGRRFVLYGYADSWAKMDYNYRLSEKRIASVQRVLVEADVPLRNIVKKARGETFRYLAAINPGKHNVEQVLNRRVEVCVIK